MNSTTRERRLPQHQLLHWFIRLFAVINIVNFESDRIYPAYGHWVANGRIGSIAMMVIMLSVFLLPLCVGLEAFWMRNAKVERKAIWIDAAFVLVWFVSFVNGLWYAFTHHVPF